MLEKSDKPEEKPTAAEPAYLPTKKEEALLETMLNPLNRLKTVEELCRITPCDKSIYYTAFKKAGFVKLYRDMSIALTVRAIAPVINSVVRQASRGSHQHAKIILGMSGLYNEKQEIIHSGHISQDPLPPAEAMAKMIEMAANDTREP